MMMCAWARGTYRVLGYILLLASAALLSNCVQSEELEPSPERTLERNLARLRSLSYLGGTTVLPDAPSGVVQFDPARTTPGYRLYTIQALGRAELISETGEVVRVWQDQTGDRWGHSELLPNGDLLAIGMVGHGWKQGSPSRATITDRSRYVSRIDWNGRLRWRRRLRAHHDIEVTPSGQLLLLTFDRRMEPSIHPEVVTRDDQLTLLDQKGKVVDSRSMLDSVRRAPERFELLEAEPSHLGGPPWIDLFHANSVEWMHQPHLFSVDPLYGPDNILVSIRHQDRVANFNWQSREVVWSWGADQISGPHDAQVLENGNILLFDNGLGRDWSRAIELDPLTEQIVWEYRGTPKESFYTQSKGSVQRLPNGNTLIAESDRGRAIEVTPDGDVVWEFFCPYEVELGTRPAIVRMVHYDPAFVDPLLSGISNLAAND